MGIRLVVWDFNSTVIADATACCDTDNHVLTSFGGNPVEMREFRETIIIPAVNFYVLHGCNMKELLDHSERVAYAFHGFYEHRAAKIRTRKNARRVLNFLAKNQIESVILSNHTGTGIRSQLERLRLEDCFRTIIASSSLSGALRKRSKFQRLRDYMARRKYDPQDVVIVGDSPEEVEIGKKLGIVTIAITDGYYSTWRLKDKNPDHLITNLGSIIEIINELSWKNQTGRRQ